MSLLLTDEVTTFYHRNPELNLITSSTTEWSIVHEKRGLSAPKTIFSLTTDRTLLACYVEYLGGFPIILKVVGGTRGIGTIKAESWHSLLSMSDYLVGIGAKFILRQFIEAEYGVRALVIGKKIVDSSRFYFQENDFRNAPLLAKTKYEPHQLEGASEHLCMAAVDEIGLEMGGVDLLYDKSGAPYLLEVNFPVGFQSFQDRGPVIARAMVAYLVTKARR
jgi:glutathione synthase/RimK-type ligase-like ATP-grasp enzyme